MNNQDFDRFVRNSLSAHQSPVDTEALWAGVDARVGHTRGKGAAMWWFLLPAGLVLVGAAWFYLSAKGDAGPRYSPRTAAGQEIFVKPEPATATETAMAERPLATSPQAGGIAAVAAPTFTPVAKASQIKPVTTNPQISAQFDTKAQKVEPAAGAVQGSISSFSTAQAPFHTAGVGHEPSGNPGLANPVGRLEAENSGEATKQPTTQPIPLALNTGTEAYSKEEPASEADPFALNPIIPLAWPEGMVQLEIPARLETLHPAEAEKPAIQWFLLTDVALGAVQRSLQPESAVWDDYADTRQATEKTMESFAAQFRAGIQTRSGWFLTAGLATTRIHEEFSLNRMVTETTLETYISEIHIGQGGDTSYTYSTGELTTTTTQRVRQYNTHRLLDIPVTFGYEWQPGQLAIAAEGGVMVNLRYRTEGTMLAPDGEVIAVEGSGLFAPGSGLSYVLGARIGYSLGPRVGLYLSPGLRFIPASVVGFTGLDQRYTIYSLGAGVAYRFR